VFSAGGGFQKGNEERGGRKSARKSWEGQEDEGKLSTIGVCDIRVDKKQVALQGAKGGEKPMLDYMRVCYFAVGKKAGAVGELGDYLGADRRGWVKNISN